MHNAFLGVSPAKIEWLPSNESSNDDSQNTSLTPFCPLFDDIYFNTKDGIAESQYVYLEGNNLATRFSKANEQFVIFETGFGTGLNFLLSCELWQASQNQGHLHYYSVEQYPLQLDDLEKVYRQLGLNCSAIEPLIEQYPPILPGIYSLKIADNISLHLLFYPLAQALKEIAVNQQFVVDAWFLDGFAPSKNPQMWHKGLLHFMALHAENSDNRQTTVATFTAASQIRKMLQHYGFIVSKRKGFAYKREMLCAAFEQKKLSTAKPNLASAFLSTKKPVTKVAIIGAGLAGCTSAYSLHKRNIHVEIFEQGSEIASGASAMPALLATPNLSIDHNAYSQFTFAGFYWLIKYLQDKPQLVDSWQALQLTSEKYSAYQLQQYANLYQQRVKQAIQWLAPSSNSFNEAGLQVAAIQLNGLKYCQSLIEQIPQQQVHLNSPIKSMQQLSQFDQVIICNGYHSTISDLGIANLPSVLPLRGQLSAIDSNIELELPINHDGHLFKYQQQLILGASFSNSTDCTVNKDDDLANLEQAKKRFALEFKPSQKITSYVGIRASTYDRFPFTGLASEQAKQSIWFNYGFGTRGLCLSLICAEIIAASINNETLPVSKNILQRLNPTRIKTKK